MRKLLRQTAPEKAGTLDGMNLFFGALLGANLGTMGAVGLTDYAILIILLAGTVMTIRVVSTSERRGYALAMLAFNAALLGTVLSVPALRPEGLDTNESHRLLITLAVWIGSVLLVEYYPHAVGERADADPES